PIAIKDLTNTKGLRTTYGTLLNKDHIPDRDATVVARLKDAGVLIMGKTNTPEYGYKATTDNLVFGATRNPWNLETNSGGSSGGSAAAVSAGLVPLAEGSDGGGSVRIPASLCGIFGFKPSYGKIPFDNHLDGVFGTHEPFLHYGTLTRSVADAALMFDVMKGYADTDPFSLPDDHVSALQEIKKGVSHELKIGWSLDLGMFRVDNEVADRFYQAIDRLSAAGFHVQAVDVHFGTGLREYMDDFVRLWTAGLGSLKDTADRHPEMFSSGLIKMIEKGNELSSVEFKNLEAYRARVWHKLQGLFRDIDILLSPTLAAPAVPWDQEGPQTINGKPLEEIDSDWVMTQVYNITGQPAITIPIGLTKDGLPVGMQAASARLNDYLILRFAHMYEQQFPTLAGAVMGANALAAK
ncbi:MAG: amidase, partial [Tuberibacillus sp.]